MSRRQRKINEKRKEMMASMEALALDIDRSSREFRKNAEEHLCRMAGRHAVEELRKEYPR